MCLHQPAGQAVTCFSTPVASQKASLQRVDVGAVAVWCSGAKACQGSAQCVTHAFDRSPLTQKLLPAGLVRSDGLDPRLLKVHACYARQPNNQSDISASCGGALARDRTLTAATTSAGWLSLYSIGAASCAPLRPSTRSAVADMPSTTCRVGVRVKARTDVRFWVVIRGRAGVEIVHQGKGQGSGSTPGGLQRP